MHQLSEDADIHQLRFTSPAALRALDALLEDYLIAVRGHPEDRYRSLAYYVEVLLEEHGVRLIVFGQACRHENDMAL